MVRRLLTILLPVLVLGTGTLWAQSEAVDQYLERGLALSKAEKFDQALTYFLFALELGEEEFGADSPSVVPLLDDLAEIYAARSHYGDAEPLFERSLEIQERALNRYRSGIARTLNRLGAIYEATARPDAARQAYTRVLADLQPGLGAGDPSVQTARLRLAKLDRLPPPPAIATLTRVPTLPAPAASAPTVVAAPPAVPAPEAAAGYRLHLTSVRQSGQVPDEWRRLRQVYPALLSGLELAVARVDLGTGLGVWFRVEGGPLTRAEAKRRCGLFTQRGIWCAVRRSGAAPSERRVAAEKPPAAARDDAAQVAAADGYRIHLTSIRREADAVAEWLRLQRQFRALLADLRLSVMRADLGAERGVWYRIQGGPLVRAEARSALCHPRRAAALVPGRATAGPNLRRRPTLRRASGPPPRPGRVPWHPAAPAVPSAGTRRAPIR